MRAHMSEALDAQVSSFWSHLFQLHVDVSARAPVQHLEALYWCAGYPCDIEAWKSLGRLTQTTGGTAARCGAGAEDVA